MQKPQEGLTYVRGLPRAAVSMSPEAGGTALQGRRVRCSFISFVFRRYPFTEDQEIPETDWEVYLRETANAIVSQQTPQR